MRDLHLQEKKLNGAGGCEQPDQRRAGLKTAALISWKEKPTFVSSVYTVEVAYFFLEIRSNKH